MIQHLEQPAGLPPVNGYSHATTGSGRIVAVSGQLPLDGSGQIVSSGDLLGQARQVFVNIGIALAAAGAGPSDILRLTVYLTDLSDLDDFRTARDEFIGDALPPASSLVQVDGLVLPGARVEVDTLAVVAD